MQYRGREIPKDKVISGQVGSSSLRNKLPSECAENCAVTAQKPVDPLRKNLPQTNNTTKKDKNKDTATPSPLPTGGQAQALHKTSKEPTLREFEQRNQEMTNNWEKS